MKNIICVNNLYKLYRVGDTAVRALDGVSFTVREGEFCAIVGTSGSGKSTLLNMLAGLERPTKGEVIINGHHIEKMNESELVSFRGNNVGFIFQSFHLLPALNALENVALPLSFRGEERGLRKKKAEKMLRMVSLEKQKNHMPNQMSGGQQQRVSIARALVSDPRIIFADEPTGNLDSRTSEDVMRLMQKIVSEQGRTLVMVTHDMNEAEYADRIIRVIDGKIVENKEKRRKQEI
ncbi:ABC transporter ATP-binding protein [Ruminococcus sp. CLA-AA-H200]|uniref:ABC transporter ATP-binding protein n=1 Tax=Ruminococcus turbiniformis TaxID=2881258 RepID=A0ABS8FWH6_9FIRM|nr:ABC transporter ATP-binding protein [Ruminococcus turbiniformis]MCC2254403.1 ABC transporter ATP-binding protein [Ruminococcus turbiniformis]